MKTAPYEADLEIVVARRVKADQRTTHIAAGASENHDADHSGCHLT
jgi:hypothetical protein